MRRFTWLTIGLFKKVESLEAACALHFAYYNLCWRTDEMRVTPAMAAGATDRLWSISAFRIATWMIRKLRKNKT